MAFPVSPYIDQEDGALRIAGTRVGLDTIIAHFEEEQTPEQIVHSFPTVRLRKYMAPLPTTWKTKSWSTTFLPKSIVSSNEECGR